MKKGGKHMSSRRVMTIANTDIQVIEYKGERVLTTEQTAQIYGCAPIQLQQNFNNNKEHFEEGKHFFKLTGEDLRQFKDCLENIEAVGVGRRAPQVYLWTRRGAARHCKMLGTDRAWDMFDSLEEHYFNRQEVLLPSYMIENPAERARRWADEMEAKQGEIRALAADNEAMKPKAVFADAVSASRTSINIGDLAKLLKQNGIDMGQKRLFGWLRENGWLMKGGTSKNLPTQKGMEQGLFEIKEGTYIDGHGVNVTTKTPKVTGKGQIYFVNKFLAEKAG